MRAVWVTTFLCSCSLAACLDLAPADDPVSDAAAGGTGGSSGTGGWPGGGGSAAGSGGSAAGSGGTGGVGVDAGDAWAGKTPFDVSDFSSEHSGDSVPNATSVSLTASIPLSTRFLIACRHARDNDTGASYPGAMTVAGMPMSAIDGAVTGVYNNNMAGVHCFQLEDPPTGTQTVEYVLGAGSYDYMRLSTFYFNRPAQISAHSVSKHATGNQHGQSVITAEPAVVLVIYTKYYTHLLSTVGFSELFDQAGFGGDAVQYAAALVQGTAGSADWQVTWAGSSSWGGSQLVAVVPK